ncbi:MAG TPA: BREX system ATP-binding domain-containing protein [Kofleriaceae bacterium]|nr:BREX system ATP-binding domain-containing protein [Kofleriaceae bacterium]
MTPPSRPPENQADLTTRLARKILSQVGENGKPPEYGINHVNVGNETYLRILDKFYIEEVLLGTDGSSFKLIQGTYGAGKTHFLYCVRDLAWRRNLLAAFVTISPKECPLNKPLGVYRAVAQNLELAREHEDSDPTRGLDDILRHRAETVVDDLGREEALRWVESSLARAPLARHSFRDAAVRYLRAVIEGEDEERLRRLAAWLRGEPIPASEAKAEGLYEMPSNDNGFAMLRSLVQAASRLGFEGTVLLLDEAERRLSVDGKRTKAHNETVDHLRELVDLCGRSELPRLLLLYAVTPAFTQNVLPAYPALQQRLGWPIQYLSSHNPKAPLIDLEALDLEPVGLLTEMGKRLVRVARLAYGWVPDEKGEVALLRNLRQLVETVTEEQLEVSHRRLFVKIWIRLLDELRLGGERDLGGDEVKALVRDEQVHLLQEDVSELPTFFGQPVPDAAPVSDKPRGKKRRSARP